MDRTDKLYDVFISYRRDGGSETARLLKEKLEQEGYRVFLDVEELKTGKFDENLLRVIQNSPNFLLILSPGSLDRCANPDDWLTKEIAHAMSHKRILVPIMKGGFSFPKEGTLHASIEELPLFNGVEYSHTYVQAVISELKSRLELAEAQDRANENFNLAGNLDGSGQIEFKELMPSWCSVYVFRIWPIVMALQWLVVLPVAILNSTASQIDVSQFDLDPKVYKETHALFQDVMFIVWNLIPFALIALLSHARRSVQQHVRSIYLLDRKDTDKEKERCLTNWKVLAARNNGWAKIISHWAVVSGIAAIGAYACFVQVEKLEALKEKGEIYWWDWTVSKLAYIVREIALFTDFVGLALLIVVVIALIDVISKILRGTNLTIDVNSGDRANGLGSVGSALLLFLPFSSVLALNSVIGTVDHKGQDVQQVFSDYLTLGGFMVLYFLLFVGPMLPVRRQVQAFLRNEVNRIRWRRQSLEGKSKAILDQAQQLTLQQAQLYQALGNVCTLLQQQERKLRTATTWPMRWPTLLVAVLVGVLPGLVFVLIQVLWRGARG